jgi:ethanolamine utilization protein EutQ (cupin superfamily)
LGPVTYEGYDEIVYLMAGEAELEFDGTTHQFKAGSALFIPDGCSYKYRTVNGPNELIAVFSPARF